MFRLQHFTPAIAFLAIFLFSGLTELKAQERAKKENYNKMARQGARERNKINAFDDGESKGNKAEDPSTAADRMYNRMGYMASIDQYLQKNNLTLDDKLKIANAYRLVHDTENAEMWYAQAVDQSSEPLDYLHYAQTLQSNGKLGEAAKYFTIFDEKNTQDDSWNDLAQIFTANVGNDDRFRTTDVELINEFNINSKKLEFSPAFYKEGVIYVSTKKPEKMRIGVDPWLEQNFMTLYYADKSANNLLDEPVEFSYDITTKYHEGPVSFSDNFTTIYFTRNHFNGSRKNNSEGIMKLQIYSSKRNGNKWSKPKELNINTREYEEAHPSLTKDGKTMFFASDRTGGYGGMDLYKTTFVGKEWTEPINLGPEINTAGNEVFPFIHDSGMLFYSSNGKDGIGGLDIYFTLENETGDYANATNMGTPFNSEKDDFGLIIDPKGKFGYLTSARKNGSGGDDIYSFNIPSIPAAQKLTKICVYDEETQKRIPGAEVNVALFSSDLTLNSTCFGEGTTFDLQPTDHEGEYLLVLKSVEANGDAVNYITDENGFIEIMVEDKTNYRLEANVDGYELSSQIVTFTELESGRICIPVRRTPDCPDLTGIVWNENSGQPLPGAQVTLINECTGNQTTYVADNNGAFSFPCLACGCKYYVKAEKDNFSKDVASFDIPAEKCSKDNSIQKDLRLKLDFEEPIEAGDVIVLENIFYDFDKYYIRNDAEEELDHVVSLMLKYPNMIIELGSHTDSRGSHSYNDVLSSNRAKSAVQYIISRGIDQRRIVAKGYGENINRNRCADGVRCSEEEHQFNRRTEIKVLHFPNPNIDVQYNDNSPEYIDRAPSDIIGYRQSFRSSESSYTGISNGRSTKIATPENSPRPIAVNLSNNPSFGSRNHDVIVGSYSTLYNAQKKLDKVKSLGYEGGIIADSDGNHYRVSIGSFDQRKDADQLKADARKNGLRAFIGHNENRY